jgi:hypothetical protein
MGSERRSLSVWHADFQELYRRHLCRHSQFGINVAHLVSVVGTYLALIGLIGSLAQTPWVPLGLTIPYLVILGLNIPFRVFGITVLCLAGVFGLFFVLPPLAFWWYLPALVVFHRLQFWSHRYYTRETDMTEFNKKYPKGWALFVLLSVYELPILLNYLFFGKDDWCTGGDRSTRFQENISRHAEHRDSAPVR